MVDGRMTIQDFMISTRMGNLWQILDLIAKSNTKIGILFHYVTR